VSEPAVVSEPVVVHQLLSGAGPTDAITSEALAFRACFARWGWGGADYAYRIAPGAERSMRPAARLRSAPGELVLLHHSAGWPDLEHLLALPGRKLLLHHNVTPPEWLWEHAPVVAAHCAAGRRQLEPLARAADGTAADSDFNASDLRALGIEGTTVIPLLVDFARLGPPPAGEAPEPCTVLFVGRLSPHKRQSELIAAFAAYRRYRDPDARLVLVGDAITVAYRERLRTLAQRLAPGAVSIESDLDAAQLGERYRRAHAFVCLSAHEGFCIPLLEAMHFGLPVIARPAGAVAETLGDAGMLLEDRDPAVLCELIHLVLTDGELRAELRRRGAQRAGQFATERVAQRLREAVLEALGARSPSPVSAGGAW
jgi:glycosyltransferase involved in cell wall biosynthesis